MLLDVLRTASSSSTNAGWLGATAALASSPGPRSGGRSGTSGSPVAGNGAAGRASSCSGAEQALRLLRTLLRADASMAAAVVDQGGVPVLLQLLQAPCMGALTQIRQAVLLCLSELCSSGSRAGSTAVRQAGWVGLLLKECQRWVRY